ncbi:MATE family efflux transporter [Piscinibacter gummiphilus]|uniref:MATE family efflux transporter n=1 Tax=Piscinibacter gummiphilus TaxID=946333 RepID=A0ABZ0CNY7_9BURK|nr:MATE family efflux transporter [Piscinibacter gummiphilus]WOB06706.1 MATE family efflux transporter [Piscinibacter gummiphilus]
MSMLTGPILPTLLRLALPNVLAMASATAVGIAETAYIGQLGLTPLAAMALVFPFAMLMQMFSAGAMGGGISSAISRALGAKDQARAETLALHAALIGGSCGLFFMVLFIAFGHVFYAALGGQGEVLAEATRYGMVLFVGVVAVWLTNSLSSVLRGGGDMRMPSTVILTASLAQIVIGACLGLGLGPFPRLGMAGVALVNVLSFTGAALYLLYRLMRADARVRLRWRGVPLQKAMFFDILKVGGLACLSPLQSVATVILITALVARTGVEALAGYAIGSRLEFLLIPIAFGIGVAAVPMVGMAIGAGDVTRARRVAWTSGAVSAVMLAVVGLVVTVAPNLWSGMFTQQQGVLDAAARYLRSAGPAFPFFGLGLTLYFASQGSGKVLGTVLAGTARFLVVLGVGLWLGAHGASDTAMFLLVGAAMVVYGIAAVVAIYMTPWSPKRAAVPEPIAA